MFFKGWIRRVLPKRWSEQARVSSVLTLKDIKADLTSWELVLTVGVVYGVLSFVLSSIVSGVRESDIVISTDPLAFTYLISILLPLISVSLSSLISVIREKQNGTLQVLFFGPVSSVAYLMAKFLGRLFVYIVFLLFILVYFICMGYMTNIQISVEFLKIMLTSLLLSACIVNLSLLISVISRSIAKAILLMIVLILGFSGADIMHRLFLNLSLVTGNLSLAYFREFFAVLRQIMGWISPLRYFFESYDAVFLNAGRLYYSYLGLQAVYTVVLFLIAYFAFERYGVLPNE